MSHSENDFSIDSSSEHHGDGGTLSDSKYITSLYQLYYDNEGDVAIEENNDLVRIIAGHNLDRSLIFSSPPPYTLGGLFIHSH